MGEERLRHAEEILDALPSGGPVILAGDLHEAPDGPAVHLLLTRFMDAFAVTGEGPGYTFPASSPAHRLDYVLATRDVPLRPRGSKLHVGQFAVGRIEVEVDRAALVTMKKHCDAAQDRRFDLRLKLPRRVKNDVVVTGQANPLGIQPAASTDGSSSRARRRSR